MPGPINRIAALMLIAFMALIGALGVWAMSGPSLTAREDNPRRILDERRILRGSILDRRGEVIVETIGEPGTYTRYSRYPDAAPFTGYYSINYGTSGVEQTFDSTLRGAEGIDPLQVRIDRLLHVEPIGRPVQLAIDLGLQRRVDALFRGQTGAVVVLDVPGGDVLALSSRPTFDPNTLDEQWDKLRADPSSPLLNRATQGRYQPGTILQSVILGEALDRALATLDEAPEFATAPLQIGSSALDCRDDEDVITLRDAFGAACPTPFADLGVKLGGDALWAIAEKWNLTGPEVTGIQVGEPITPAAPLADMKSLREFAAGQGALTVSPLQMASIAAALATRGVMPAPRIVSATLAIDGSWQAIAREPAHRVLPAAIGQQVVAAMPQSGETAWHAGIGLSGPAKLLWFIGFTPIERPRYAVVVLIEAQADASGQEDAALIIGRMLLNGLAASP